MSVTAVTAPVVELNYDDFFCREFSNVAREAYYVLGDRDAAVEVAQEAFIRLYQRWSKVSKYDVPYAWVRRVAIRIAVKNRFRRFRENTVEEIPDSAYNDSEYYHDLRRAIMELPRAQKAAVVLYYFEDLSVEEVANIIGCRRGTAKTHLARARARLAEVLTDRDSEEAR